jgi:hypothetical protein
MELMTWSDSEDDTKRESENAEFDAAWSAQIETIKFKRRRFGCIPTADRRTEADSR